jgi:hypothetical protein
MCCLKRPFDDQTQARIRLESEAVLVLLSAPREVVEFVRGVALDLENDQNPLAHRAAKVRQWLDEIPLLDLQDDALKVRTEELMLLGFRNFDAFHLACAELGGAERFCTCDDRLLAAATRNTTHLKIRVLNPVDLAKEVFP